MRTCTTKILLLIVAIVSFGALGCAGSQTPGDTGVGDGQGGNDGDKTVLCQTNEDCGAGEECRGGVCISATACNCNYDCDKANGEVCNKATNQCESGQPPFNCLSDCDCYTGESCISGDCQSTGGDQQSCVIDGDCPQGQVCKGGKCVNESCTTRDDCAPPACVCKEGKCTTPPPVCQGDDDCCTDYRCNFGTCIPIDTGCKSDAECEALNPDFPKCVDSQCVQECVNDIDCPLAGQVCIDNKCETPGCTPDDCPLGQWCDTGDGQCKNGCDSNDDCTPPDTCNYATHQCGQTDCCGGTCDPQTQYCDTLTCQCVEACQSDADCPQGYTCNPPKCWCNPGSCPTGSQCNTQTGECELQCQDDTDCPAGWTCNTTTGKCEQQQAANEGATCFSDSQCDQTTNPPLKCDNCFFCVIFDDTFEATFTCRYSCSIILPSCPIADRDCQSRRIPYQGLCMPTGP